jgi:hypothetical protein
MRFSFTAIRGEDLVLIEKRGSRFHARVDAKPTAF